MWDRSKRAKILTIPNQPINTTSINFSIESALADSIIFNSLLYPFAGGYSEGNKVDSCFSYRLYSQDRSAETNIKPPNNNMKLLNQYYNNLNQFIFNTLT